MLCRLLPCSFLLLGCLACQRTAEAPSSAPASKPTPAAEAIPVQDPKYVAEIEAWRQERLSHLTAEDGWLTLVGLHWLKDGTTELGACKTCEPRLPGAHAPRSFGALTVKGTDVSLKVTEGVDVKLDGKVVKHPTLKSDAKGQKPTVLSFGPLTFFVIERGGALALRVRDSQATARQDFHGIPTFPVDARWRITGKFEPYTPPREVETPTAAGVVEKQVSPGAVVFTLQGQTVRLETVQEPGSSELFIVFADATSGKETYGSGRFVYAAQPVQGQVTVDFNRAYNPPCAFSAFATCPLPPPGNRLAQRIEAGEKTYSGSPHDGANPH